MRNMDNRHGEKAEELRQLARRDFGAEGQGLGKAIDNYQNRAKALKQAIIEKVKSLPDNPRITRQSDGKSFTISNKDLGDELILSAFYHDFKAQYQQLADWIEAKTPEQILHIIGHIFEFGYWQGKKFHPDVIEHLKSIQ